MGCRMEYCDFRLIVGFAGDSNLAALAAIEFGGTCRWTSFSTAPILEVVECDHLLMFLLGDRFVRLELLVFSTLDWSAAASRTEKCWLIESELVGLVFEYDDLCPILDPMCLIVETEDEVEFERESLLFTAGANTGTFMVAFFHVKGSSNAHVPKCV